jgi:hypothetical protein
MQYITYHVGAQLHSTRLHSSKVVVSVMLEMFVQELGFCQSNEVIAMFMVTQTKCKSNRRSIKLSALSSCGIRYRRTRKLTTLGQLQVRVDHVR